MPFEEYRGHHAQAIAVLRYLLQRVQCSNASTGKVTAVVANNLQGTSWQVIFATARPLQTPLLPCRARSAALCPAMLRRRRCSQSQSSAPWLYRVPSCHHPTGLRPLDVQFGRHSVQPGMRRPYPENKCVKWRCVTGGNPVLNRAAQLDEGSSQFSLRGGNRAKPHVRMTHHLHGTGDITSEKSEIGNIARVVSSLCRMTSPPDPPQPLLVLIKSLDSVHGSQISGSHHYGAHNVDGLLLAGGKIVGLLSKEQVGTHAALQRLVMHSQHDDIENYLTHVLLIRSTLQNRCVRRSMMPAAARPFLVWWTCMCISPGAAAR